MKKLNFSKAALYFFAIFGIVSAFIFGSLFGLLELLSQRTVEEEVYSPDKTLKVVRLVTRGGFGTVYTTRLHVKDEAGEEFSIYSNTNSDYVPKVEWVGPEHLEITIHCGRVNHMGNPSAYEDAKTAIGRLRVKFLYDDVLCEFPEGDQ